MKGIPTERFHRMTAAETLATDHDYRDASKN